MKLYEVVRLIQMYQRVLNSSGRRALFRDPSDDMMIPVRNHRFNEPISFGGLVLSSLKQSIFAVISQFGKPPSSTQKKGPFSVNVTTELKVHPSKMVIVPVICFDMPPDYFETKFYNRQ